MSLDLLKKDIKESSFKNVYLFYGEEEYLKNEYLKKIEKSVIDLQFADFNKVVFEEKANESKIIDACDTLPVFADKKLVVVKYSGFFKGSKSGEDADKSKTKNEELTKFLASVPSHVVLIFMENEVDKRLKLYKIIQKIGMIVEFELRSEAELSNWVALYLGKSGKKVSRDAVMLIIEYLDQGIQQMINELDKLVGYLGDREAILVDDVKKVCTKSIKSRIFDLVDSVATNNGARTIELFEEMIALKEPIQKIFVLLAKQFRNMFFILELQEQSISPKDISSKLGIMPFIVNKLSRQASRFGKKKLSDLVNETYELDVKVKSGLINSQIATEVLISKAVDYSR
jgi:DNA polymerase-3 subunit delta